MFLWLADASSVDFLNLSVPEFHQKKKTTLISALDLSSMSCTKSLQLVPNVKLFHVFRQVDYGKLYSKNKERLLALETFFHDFSRITVGKLQRRWMPETLHLYLKQVRIYNRYIMKSLYPVSSSDYADEPLSYQEHHQRLLQKSLLLKIDRNLMKILLNNVPANSKFFEEYFRSVCISRDLQARCFHRNKAEVWEYLLCYLKKEEFNIVDTWMKEVILKYDVMKFIRSKPGHMLVLLNYGFKDIYQPYTYLWRFNNSHSILIGEKKYNWRRLTEEEQKHEKLREAVIHEIFCLFPITADLKFRRYLETLNIYWRSIPDACISYQEMKRVLVRYIHPLPVKYMLESFQECGFNGFSDIPRTRSLKHLCRCAIRDAMIRNSQLPEGIGSLGLPPRLQSFIRLDF